MHAVFAIHEHSSHEDTHLTKCVYELSLCHMANNSEVNMIFRFFTVPQPCSINVGNLSVYFLFP